MQLNENRTKHILIVEDEGLIAADVQKKLERLGYPIPAVAQSGMEALRCARSTPFDLVLMDIRLKGAMDGIATAQALKAEFEVPVVYLTAHADQDTIDRAKRTEPLGYILKPTTDGDLRSVVQISLYRHEMERRVRTSEAWLSTTLSSVGVGIIAPDTAAEGPAASRPVDELLGAIVVLRDITARRRMESLLVQSQRMEAVANMAGGLAHDFNNQLTVILGYAEKLCVQADGHDKEAALEIKHAASMASSITEQLLMLSRRGEARLEVLNVNDVICEVQPIISHSLGKIRTLVTDLSSPEGFVRGDRTQLKQVLLNLALNARDAMSTGGQLRIESSTVEINSESPEARLYRPGRFVRLRVADTGEGMDKATLARIFEPFFSTKKAFGAGLGLSIAHSIIVQGQGFIRAESEVGHGTSFEILLPCVGTFRGIGEVAGSQRPQGEDATPTVLLVEDEDAVRRLMHRFLEREGYQLLEARNAAEAEAIAEVYQEPIHVLITDVLMPGMTGPQLDASLKALRPAMKTLFVSGYRHDVIEAHGLSRGGLNLLSKPFPAAELVRRVRMLLAPGTGLAQLSLIHISEPTRRTPI